MDSQELLAKRNTVGLLSLGCFLSAGLIVWLIPHRTAAMASCIRLGLFMGAFWLAIPLIARQTFLIKWFPWYGFMGMLIVLSVARHPLQAILFVLPVFFVLGMLSMFSSKKRSRQQRSVPRSSATAKDSDSEETGPNQPSGS